MARTVAIGNRDFGEIIKEQYFYVDKTDFIKEWWENKDKVTLITRPRRFGKTLNMSMLDYFFPLTIKMTGIFLQGFLFGSMKNIESSRELTQWFH